MGGMRARPESRNKRNCQRTQTSHSTGSVDSTANSPRPQLDLFLILYGESLDGEAGDSDDDQDPRDHDNYGEYDAALHSRGQAGGRIHHAGPRGHADGRIHHGPTSQ